MYRAKVMSTDDPERRGRIRVQCPSVLGDYLSAWCEPCIPYATDFAGDYYVPPVGEGVWVQFEEGNVDKPIWGGGWYKENSTPLTNNAEPGDFRYIVFKDSVMRMGQSEFIFELKDDSGSHIVAINSDTWLGLNYISSYDEHKVLDLENLVINKEWLLVTRPEEENRKFQELQSLITSLGEAYTDFTQNVFPGVIDGVYKQVQKSYEASHSELSSVVSQLNNISLAVSSIGSNLSDVYSKIDEIKTVMNENTVKANEIFATINAVEVDGERLFDEEFPQLEEIE